MTERTDKGQFPAGVSGNPKGRPKGSKNEIVALKQDMELALRQHVKPEKLKKVIEKVINKAANGNIAAAKLIFDYFLSRVADNDDNGKEQPAIRVIVENATFKVEQERTAQVVEVTQVEDLTMSTGADANKQKTGADSSGGNIVNKGPTDHKLHQPPNFLGQSGTPNNQSTSRGKGTT
jgi:hypothetical protein